MVYTDKTLDWLGRLAIADGHLADAEIQVIIDYCLSIDMPEEKIDEYINILKIKASRRIPAVVPIRSELYKGYCFENYVFDRIFCQPGISVESRSTDFKIDQHQKHDIRSTKPDMQISQNIGGFTVRYWLECKYRRAPNSLSLRDGQAMHYLNVQQQSGLPVFIILGECGRSDAPDSIYLIPINDIVCCKVAFFYNNKFCIKTKWLTDYKVDIDRLYEYVKNIMFSQSFAK